MPTATVKKYAKMSRKPVAVVEKIWDECKVKADSKFKDRKQPGYWAYVNNCTKKKLGLSIAKECLMCEW